MNLADGRQRQFPKRQEADDFADAERRRELSGLGVVSVEPFEKHAASWLKRMRATVRPATVDQYEWALRYVLPALGARPMAEIRRAEIKDFLTDLRSRAGKRGKPLSKQSVSLVWGALRTCLESARDDGLIPSNPAGALGRSLKLAPTRGEKGARIRAFDADQAARFLEAAQKLGPRYALLFRLMLATGLRPGEAAALAWSDLDLPNTTLTVRRTKGSDATKTGDERMVDLAPGVAAGLKAWALSTKAAALKAGARRARWIFATGGREQADLSHMRKRFTRALELAGLPSTFSPHSLRHTYASLMLAAGEPLAYVAEQLGHADIRLTVHLYGRWLRKRAPGAVGRLEDAVRKKSVSRS